MYFAPQLFVRQIDNYIQGTATNNMPANMLANAMSGNSALKFKNVDAEIVGFDFPLHYRLNSHFQLQSALSVSRGKRSDGGDKLYRQAPDRLRLALVYQQNAWQFFVESAVYRAQKNVSNFNGESESAGYALVNANAQWQVNDSVTVNMQIHNVFDRTSRPPCWGESC